MPEFRITKTIGAFLGAAAFSAAAFSHAARDLPNGFVRASEAAPGVLQDMRYASRNNVLGRPLSGYAAGECILRNRAAAALAKAQAALEPQGFGLMVFDCYRPARAVRDLVQYSKGKAGSSPPYHPRVDGPGLLTQGYVAARSGHSTGLAVDLTLVRLGGGAPAQAQPDCGGPRGATEADMGTGFDCFDPMAGGKAALTPEQSRHRAILSAAMIEAGFTPYVAEWWHFSLPPRTQAERQAMDFTIR